MKKIIVLVCFFITNFDAYGYGWWSNPNEIQITLSHTMISNDDQLRQAKQAKRLIEVELTYQQEELDACNKKYSEILKEQDEEHKNQLKLEAAHALKILQECTGKEQCSDATLYLDQLCLAYTKKLKQFEIHKEQITQHIKKINGRYAYYIKEKEAFEKNIADYENRTDSSKE